jgi:hypothetical protein
MQTVHELDPQKDGGVGKHTRAQMICQIRGKTNVICYYEAVPDLMFVRARENADGQDIISSVFLFSTPFVV